MDSEVKEAVRTDEPPVVWGCDAIGRIINRSRRQTFHLLANGKIKCAKRVGNRWVAGRAALLREFGASHD
jgi:hypothetical protein